MQDEHLSIRKRILCLVGVQLIFLSLLLLAACSQALPSSQAEVQETKIVTQTVEKEVIATVEPSGEVLPTPFPHETAVPQPSAVPPTPAVEQRTVELEWPERISMGDSDVVRLALVPSEEGYQVTAEFPEHQVQSQEIPVPRPDGYYLQAAARLDGVGFTISPPDEQAFYLTEGESLSWRWSLTPRSPGQQRLSVTLLLRWLPETDAAGPVRESVAYSKSMHISVTSFFGLTRGQAMTTGVLGLFFGGSLSLVGAALLLKPVQGVLQSASPNPRLVIEPHPGMKLSTEEASLLRALFRRYGRLAVESEFLSGYSGARTFLSQPIHADGRADAATIVKIGAPQVIQREYLNYEAFVKNTLPPVTARIQHAPVTLPGRSSEKSKAALQYTFISQPGHSPASLRQALLANPDPALLHKLFDTFGPNWWMQRRPYTFRVSQEYDTFLPAHLVIEPWAGKGTVLDGRLPPADLHYGVGQIVALRGFSTIERRVEGPSLSLRGSTVGGQPPLRVRWLGLSNPNGAAGKIVATRHTLLADFVQGFDRLGLPDPLECLGSILNETVAGSRSIIHGDLNLENVLAGPGDFVWLIDFAQTREGHPLFDFAHLHAQVVAHVIAPNISAPADFLSLLDDSQSPPFAAYKSLLAAVSERAGRCLFNPAEPREYRLALFMACLGALKFTNLDRHQKHLLYLTAAHLSLQL